MIEGRKIPRGVKPVFALLFCLQFGVPPGAGAEDIVVAVASNMGFAIREIIEDFEAGTGHTVRLSLGSSGNFFTQIQNGAPFDVYLSADITYPEQLARAGLTEPGTVFPYAVGRLALWVRNESEVDVVSLGVGALAQGEGRISIANPRHAPYGRATRDALRYYRLWDRVSGRLVLGENVGQAAQFVQSGAAEIGVIALSLAYSDPMRRTGRFWPVPAQAHEELVQGGVILSHARGTRRLGAALAFVAAILGERGQATLQRYGFSLPSD